MRQLVLNSIRSRALIRMIAMHRSDIKEIAAGPEEAYAEEKIPEYNLGYLKRNSGFSDGI